MNALFHFFFSEIELLPSSRTASVAALLAALGPGEEQGQVPTVAWLGRSWCNRVTLVGGW